MYRIVITDIHVITRLYRIGLLKYFDSREVAFFITDLCYYDKNSAFPADSLLSKKLIEEGILTVVKSDSDDIRETMLYFKLFHPRFVVKTVSALVFAKKVGYRFLTNDELLADVAQKELNLKVSGKEWLATSLVNEIGTMGITLDINMINEMI